MPLDNSRCIQLLKCLQIVDIFVLLISNKHLRHAFFLNSQQLDAVTGIPTCAGMND